MLRDQRPIPVEALRRAEVSVRVHPAPVLHMYHVVLSNGVLAQVLLHCGGHIALGAREGFNFHFHFQSMANFAELRKILNIPSLVISVRLKKIFFHLLSSSLQPCPD